MINREKLIGCKQQTIITANALESYSKSILTVTSGFRSHADQVRIYKEKFGKDYLKYMPAASAHEDGLAFDCAIENMDAAKIYVWALENAQKYGIWGVGLDSFLKYCHIDNKFRNVNKITKWVYDANGQIHYL